MKQGLALLAAHVSVCITQNKSNRYQKVNNSTGLTQDSLEVILSAKKKKMAKCLVIPAKKLLLPEPFRPTRMRKRKESQ